MATAISGSPSCSATSMIGTFDTVICHHSLCRVHDASATPICSPEISGATSPAMSPVRESIFISARFILGMSLLFAHPPSLVGTSLQHHSVHSVIRSLPGTTRRRFFAPSAWARRFDDITNAFMVIPNTSWRPTSADEAFIPQRRTASILRHSVNMMKRPPRGARVMNGCR